MKSTIKLNFSAIAWLLLSVCAPTTHAQLINSGFEAGLANWVASSSVTAPGVTTTTVSGNTWTVSPAGTLQARILPAPGLLRATAEATLGLPANALTTFNSALFTTSTNYGTLVQNVNLAAGQTFTMYWNYVSQDYAPYNDGAIATLVGPASFRSIKVLATTVNAQGSGSVVTGSYGSTGWQSVTFTAGAAGAYKLGFATYNFSDQSVDPILYIDNAPGGTANPGQPVVTTGTVTATGCTSATVTGTVTSGGGTTVSARGFVYNTTGFPTLANSVVNVGSGTGTYNTTIAGFTPGVTYYIRSFATNIQGTSYGSQITYTAGAAAPTISASGPTSICNGSSVTLTASAANGYLWSNGSTSQSIIVSQAGNFTVSTTDAFGCSATSVPTAVTLVPSATATITPAGSTALCNGGSVLLNANTGAGFTHQWFLNGNSIAGATSASYSANAAGNYSVRVTNAGGCTAVSSPLAVTANTPPTISCPANIAVNAMPASCGSYVSFNNVLVIGSPTPSVTYSVAPGSWFSVGNTTVTATATNECGAVSCTFTVTVKDNESPMVANCPANINLFATSASGAVVNYAPPVATDNCSVTSTTLIAGLAPGSVFPIGATTVSYAFTDASANTSVCSFTVNVSGVAPQIGSPGNQTANADLGACGTVVNFAATETVAIPASTISYSHAPGSVFPVGVTTVTATASNPVGVSSTSFTVTVTDNQPPSIGGLTAIAVNADNGSCAATNVALGTPTTGDNCGVKEVTNNAPASYPVGTTTVIWTVTDIHGNSSSTTQVVTVTDNQNPLVNVSNVVVSLVNGVASVSAGQINNGSSDNCGIQSVVLTGKTSYNCSNIGQHTVLLTVTDIHGNVASANALVTVVGTIPTANITAVPSNNVYTGGITTNLYLGYGPQSLTLQVNAAGGSPFTYSWSGNGLLSNSSAANPVFTATAAGNYTFTVLVTNANGCTTTATVSICVRDIRVPGTNGNAAKVYLCHVPPGNPNNPQQLSISVNAVNAHLTGHSGDRLGTCNIQPCSSPVVSAREVYASSFDEEKHVHELEIIATPNPTTTQFELVIQSHDKTTPVHVKVSNMNGKVITAVKATVGQKVRFGQEYTNGIFFAEVIQGNQRKTTKLIKTN